MELLAGNVFANLPVLQMSMDGCVLTSDLPDRLLAFIIKKRQWRGLHWSLLCPHYKRKMGLKWEMRMRPISTTIILRFQIKRTKRLRWFNPPKRDNPLPDLRSLYPSLLEHLQPAFPWLWLPVAPAGDPHSCEQFRQTHRYWHHEWREGRCYDICQRMGALAVQSKFGFSYLIGYFVRSLKKNFI